MLANFSPFVANILCLDFVNTEENSDEGLVDLIASPERLLLWAFERGVISRPQLARLRKCGDRENNKAHLEALQLRGVIRTMAGKLAANINIPKATIKILNEHAENLLIIKKVRDCNGGYVADWQAQINHSVDVVRAIAVSAIDLLALNQTARVKACGGHDCILYFYDNSKNNSRRWCSMSDCGNRSKVANYYHAHK